MKFQLSQNEIIDHRYRIREKLGEGGMSLVYRAENRENKENVAIKFLKEGVTSSYIEDVIRFKREAEVVSKFDHQSIVKLYGTGEYKNIPYLVMELLEGDDLSELLKEGRIVRIEDSIEIIKQVAEALSYVHSKGIIHRDLKPGNIMIGKNRKKHSVKLLDFGLAYIMELGQIKGEEEVAGTFGYMSPEATGIVSKRVDERSDLYSLGVIFYRLLTREMPFKGKEINKIIHQQVAVVPLKPRKINPDIPSVLEEMVMKLLFKEPDLRYQSARGLVHDIERLEKREASFAIGQRDQRIKLSYETRLIGREAEFAKLKVLFNQAKDSQGGLCLIAGEAGLGKSRLVEEMRGYVYEQEGIFVGGRCFDQENKIPYQPFRDAINGYIRNIEKLDKKQREEEIGRIKGVLGGLAKIIINLNPNISGLLGEVPELVSLDPERENQRFLAVISDFFCHLAKEGRVYVLFLDDLQWADEGTLTLLEEIAAKIINTNLLILGTYRDNEVGEEHRLTKIKREAKEGEYNLQEIKLSSFSHERMNKMIAGILGEREEKAHKLTRFILEKSGGNPFFAINILRQIVEEKAVVWREEYWEEDWDKIKKLPVTANMVDMILRRIEDLPERQNNLLCVCSVIGREFEIEILYNLLEFSKEEIVQLVDESTSIQLLDESLEKGKILFVHDRVRDAFYHKMNKEDRVKTHLKIAGTIEKLSKENIFDLAHHYIEGGDKVKSLEYLPLAAEKAKGSYAVNEAIKSYTLYIELLEEKAEKEGPKWVNAKENLVEVYLTAGMSDEAIKVSQEILPLKESLLEKARLYKKIGIGWFKKGNWEQCKDNLTKGLALLGEKIPGSKTGLVIKMSRELVIHLLHNIFPKLFSHKKGKVVKPEDKEIIWLYMTLDWVNVLSDVNKFIWSTLRKINVAESRIGKSKELGIAFTAYGALCMVMPLFKRALKYHNKAMQMRKELKDEWGIAQSLQFFGFCYNWKGENQKSIENFQQAKDRFQKIGDMWELAISVLVMGYSFLCLTDYHNSLHYYLKSLGIGQKTKDNFGISTSQAYISFCYTQMGDFTKAKEWGRKSLALSEEKKIWFVNCFGNTNFGYLELKRGNYNGAIKCLEKAKKLYEENNFIKEYAYFYPYLADAYIERLSAEGLEFKGRERKREIKKIKAACKKALSATKPWVNHYGSSLRVMGKYYALKNQRKKAEKYFLKSIAQTKALGRKYELAKSYYEYGNFLETITHSENIKTKWQQAYNIFKEIGSKEYLKRCGNILGHKEKVEIAEEDSPQVRLRAERKMATVLNTSRYLSSILDLDELLEKIMDRTLELAGAGRGLLLLYPSSEEKKPELEVKVVRNVGREELERNAFSTSRSIISRIEKEKKPLIIEDAGADDQLKDEVSVIRYGLKSVLCVPITAREKKMLGIIYLDNHLVSGLFTEEDLNILELLAHQAGVSIENALLYNRAVTDGLSGLYNHNFFENYLMKSVSQSNRYNKKLSLLMVDIDHFKKFNDTHGHRAGDLVLRTVSGVLKKSVRESDLLARYGGEEFAVVSPETDIEGAKKLGEKMRKAIEESKVLHTIKNKEVELKVTVSIGVAELEKGEDRIDLMEKSDKALYKAKSLGRNCVEVI